MPKREGALRRGAAFVVRRADGFVLVRTRPAKGLLGGMTEVPTTEWTADFDEGAALKAAPRFAAGKRQKWRAACPGMVRHVFTHFPLELIVYAVGYSGAHAGAARACAGSRSLNLAARRCRA